LYADHLRADQCYNHCGRCIKFLVEWVGKMSHTHRLFILILAASLGLFSSCRQGSSPSSTPTNQVYLYIFVTQNTPACPLTLTIVGPTTFQDDLGSSPVYGSVIAFNAGPGNYSFYFNGVTDGVSHYLSGSETIYCSPASSNSCAGWSYTVKP
jgi:hypothetical protein